ncbi:MAG: SLC13 family permease [Phycisphaerales bacterium]|nr:SLC13 family permease [Phycisphaerae bacterium]NNF42563.1 SLC13 family permease [Phycisphaerales bacterium]NNM26461.1 SLC13 family permease [Phycisphaerales bacterium]
MTWEIWYTLGSIALVIAALATNRISPDTAMVGGLTLLLLGDAALPGEILPWTDGIRGFAHPAIVMIGALFVVAAGLQQTGGMEIVAQRLLGRPRTIAGAQLRMMMPVAVMSGFMNNTPIVAMYLPIINDWAKKLRISPSKLYMPLSFSAILGGKLTLIGTASNIVVMGLYLEFLAQPPDTAQAWTAGIPAPSAQLQFWGIAAIGVPTAIAGMILIVALSRWLLPERRPASGVVLDARKYQVEMVVQPDAPIVGKTIEEAGLRHLPGLYLTQIERNGRVRTAVSPQTRLEADDRLAFTGIIESVVDLRKIRGLVPATDQVGKIAGPRQQRTLVEAVVSHNSPLVARSVRDSKFRTKYNAAIIAVHRNGEHINAKVGNIVLKPGDTLLIDTHQGFVDAHRNSDDFYLVSQVHGSHPIRHERAPVALAILGLLVVLITVTRMPPVVAALVCAGLMVITRCVTGTEARTSVNWQVLLVIGSALGMGVAMEHTGASVAIADQLAGVCQGLGPTATLGVLFLAASLFGQVITNNGAAVLMFPVMMATAQELGVRPEAFVFTLMVAAGSTFLSPVSYQTNLMVYGAGGYRFLDYARLGLPLTLLLAVMTMFLAPVVFPFS